MRSLRLAAALLLLLAARVEAAAPSVQDQAAAVRQAASQFTALAKDPARQGKVPRQSDPAAAPLIAGVFDARPPGHGHPLPFDEAGALAEWGQALAEAGFVYVLAGTGYGSAAELAKAPDLQTLVPQINQNAVIYAPEMGRFFDAQFAVSGAMADCVLAELDRHPDLLDRPNVQSGLRHMKGGAAQTIGGLLQTVVIAGLTDEWRRQRIAALQAELPILVRLLDPPQRAQLAAAATDAAAHVADPQVQQALMGVQGSLAATP